MARAGERPKAPRHLKAATRRWWEDVCRDWQLEEHHRRILTTSCEAWDVRQEAGRLLRREGLVVATKGGGPRAHPAVKIQAEARLQFFRGVRELDLYVTPPPQTMRPRCARLRGKQECHENYDGQNYGLVQRMTST